ncbi:MAG TPA: hypothetical protein VGM76_08070 [Lacipirellulaceae bacterium]
MNRFALLIAGLASTLFFSSAATAQYPAASQPPSAAPPSAYAAPARSTSPFASAPVTPPLFPSPPYVAPVTPVQYTAPPTIAPITPVSPPPSTFAAPAYPATASPYSVPPAGAPTFSPAPYSAPYTPPPAAIGPPPAFDPYATGSALGPPPPAVPYSYTPPPQSPATAYPYPPPSGTVPQTAPFGQPYGPQPGVPTVASDEGYYAKAQRFLQELSFEETFIYGKPGSLSELDINRAEIASTFALPMGYNIEAPLLVTPGFAANWLEGPIHNFAITPTGEPGTDLPPRIYDAYLDFAWYPHITPWLGGELGFRTGVWSDFDHVTTDSIRFLGRGLASISVNPTFDFLFGVVYLDRLKVKILPAGGVYWRPTPDWDAYIVFPNPKIRHYWMTVGNSKWYYYAAGEYGGGSWTVDRDGEGDRIDINDIRVIGGIEWETQTMLRGHIEAGYVFDRQVIYNDNNTAPFDAANSIMLRGGIEF